MFFFTKGEIACKVDLQVNDTGYVPLILLLPLPPIMLFRFDGLFREQYEPRSDCS